MIEGHAGTEEGVDFVEWHDCRIRARFEDAEGAANEVICGIGGRVKTNPFAIDAGKQPAFFGEECDEFREVDLVGQRGECGDRVDLRMPPDPIGDGVAHGFRITAACLAAQHFPQPGFQDAWRFMGHSA